MDLVRLVLGRAKANARAGRYRAQRLAVVAVPKRRGRGDAVAVSVALEELLAQKYPSFDRVGAVLTVAWPKLVGPLADHVAPAGVEQSSGVVVLRPDSRAWATQAQLLGAQLVERVNRFLGSELVRGVRVLEPGPVVAPRRKSELGEDEVLVARVGVHRVWRPEPPVGAGDSAVEAARERQRRERLREAVTVVGRERCEPDAAGGVRARALRRARAERWSRT